MSEASENNVSCTCFELAKRLKRQYPQVKIMAMSVGDYEAKASQAGVDAFVSKDQLHDDLVPTLRGLFGDEFRTLGCCSRQGLETRAHADRTTA